MKTRLMVTVEVEVSADKEGAALAIQDLCREVRKQHPTINGSSYSAEGCYRTHCLGVRNVVKKRKP